MSLEHLCLYYGYKLKKVDSVNSKEFQDTITLNDINVVLSITSQIYSREIINIPMLKIYNFHPSILPNNKGRFPIFWAILNNSQQGMTCHEITEQIDSGKIIHQMILPRVKSVEDGMRNVINNFGDFINISIKVIQGEVEGNVVEGEPSFYGPTPQNSDILKYKAISS
ncbi:MAG: formyltransferase family protein [Bacteriovoracaceae bacterium]|nr:formyltransferase family protein [Bacteriovoracaceae bacterium]